jgi:hypothetical protein
MPILVYFGCFYVKFDNSPPPSSATLHCRYELSKTTPSSLVGDVKVGGVSSRQVNACPLLRFHKTYLTATFLFRHVAVKLLLVNVGIGGGGTGDHEHIMGGGRQ